MSTLMVYQVFTSWKKLFEEVEKYCVETSQPFVKSSCKTCQQANKHVKSGQKLYPLDMEYVYYTFSCTHGGSFKTNGQGKRNTKSNKQLCGAKIYACLDRHDRSKIVVKQLNTEHNHEISPDLFEGYAKQRKLVDSEKAMLERLVHLNVPSKDLRKEVVRLTGKRLSMQDIHNLKKAVRRKDKQAGSTSDDTQLFVQEVEGGYGLAKRQVDRLLHLLVELDGHILQYYLDLLYTFEEKVNQRKRFVIVEEDDMQRVEVEIGSADCMDVMLVKKENDRVENDVHVAEARILKDVESSKHVTGTGLAVGSRITRESVNKERALMSQGPPSGTGRSMEGIVRPVSMLDQGGVNTIVTCADIKYIGNTNDHALVSGNEMANTDPMDKMRDDARDTLHANAVLPVSSNSNVDVFPSEVFGMRPLSKLGKRGHPKGLESTALELPKKKKNS